jgi:hypothetical protein
VQLFQQIDSRTFVHRIDVHGRLTHVNASWLEFAAENGWPVTADDVLGRPIMDSVADPQTHYLYGLLMTRLRHGRGPFSFTYRCDAPDCRRLLRMRMIADHHAREIEFQNEILSIERRTPQPLLERGRGGAGQVLEICSFCKRIALDNRWLEVEEAVLKRRLFDCEPLPTTRNRVCPDCAGKVSRIADGFAEGE